ncbi:MAG: hypothetical protein IKY55_05720 [Phascolarctobacterium sp.]|nr:hypothetical protein [Phascolarctobacterium sp.]
MFFYVNDNSNGFFWILFAFILLNFLLTIFMGGKRRSPGPIPMPEEEDYDYSTNEKSDRDLAEEFERVLGKKRDKVHTDNCEIVHDKGKLYTEPAFMEEEAVGNSKPITVIEDAPKKKLAHPKLVQGLIMEQILSKPRSLKPYGDEF